MVMLIFIHYFLVVYDIKNEENEIGTLNVSVQCLATLQAIQEELPSQ